MRATQTEGQCLSPSSFSTAHAYLFLQSRLQSIILSEIARIENEEQVLEPLERRSLQRFQYRML